MCLLENAGSAHVSRLINRYGGECPFAASGSAAVRLPDRDHKAESFYGVFRLRIMGRFVVAAIASPLRLSKRRKSFGA